MSISQEQARLAVMTAKCIFGYTIAKYFMKPGEPVDPKVHAEWVAFYIGYAYGAHDVWWGFPFICTALLIGCSETLLEVGGIIKMWDHFFPTPKTPPYGPYGPDGMC
jgi:hypothetical protein